MANKPINLEALFALGYSLERAHLIVEVLAAQATSEAYLDVYVTRAGVKEKSLKKRVEKAITEPDFARWMISLYGARNMCAHRSADFPSEEVKAVLAVCEQLVAEIEARYSLREDPRFTRFRTAMYAFFTDLAAPLGDNALGGSTLDGLYLPGVPTLADEIKALFGAPHVPAD